MCRDTGTLDGDELDVVDALRVYLSLRPFHRVSGFRGPYPPIPLAEPRDWRTRASESERRPIQPLHMRTSGRSFLGQGLSSTGVAGSKTDAAFEIQRSRLDSNRDGRTPRRSLSASTH